MTEPLDKPECRLSALTDSLITVVRCTIPKNERKDKPCVICREVRDDLSCIQFACLHYAHLRCYFKWLRYQNGIIQCPCCRDSMPDKKYCGLCHNWGGYNKS